jgi:hypothetical protein
LARREAGLDAMIGLAWLHVTYDSVLLSAMVA